MWWMLVQYSFFLELIFDLFFLQGGISGSLTATVASESIQTTLVQHLF